MATTAEIVTELGNYAAQVSAGSNGELVAALNAAKPFPKRWKAIPVDTFKALVADQWSGLLPEQKETVRFLLEGNSVNLEDAKIRAAMESIFTAPATRTALADAAREDDSVNLREVREAVLQIPAALENTAPPPPNPIPGGMAIKQGTEVDENKVWRDKDKVPLT